VRRSVVHAGVYIYKLERDGGGARRMEVLKGITGRIGLRGGGSQEKGWAQIILSGCSLTCFLAPQSIALLLVANEICILTFLGIM